MSVHTHKVSFQDIRSRILGAGFYSFRPREKIRPRFSHAHTFTYIKSGKGTVRIDETEHRVEQHDLFYIEPGRLHIFAADSEDPMVHASVYVDLLWNTSTKQTGDKLTEYRLDAYDPELSAARVEIIAEPQHPIPWPPNFKTKVPAQAEWLEAYLSVIRNYNFEDLTAAILLRSMFETFLVGFVRFLANPFEPSDPRIRKILEWMRANLTEDFQPAVWANNFKISEAYLYELFRKETGNSPLQYYMNCRLEQAKTELRETNLSVTLIAEKLGFSSIHYFSRQFARHLNESPNQYRKRIRSQTY